MKEQTKKLPVDSYEAQLTTRLLLMWLHVEAVENTGIIKSPFLVRHASEQLFLDGPQTLQLIELGSGR